MKTEMKIGLALGSGAARGLSHLGIIRALAKQGINPEIICGTSIGALVGASYLVDKLDKIEQWACALTKLDTAKFFEFDSSLKGFVNRDWLHEFLNENIGDDELSIEDQEKVYAAVATDLETGREIWLNSGSIVEAVWASISLPGLFPAIKNDNRWLVDGGLVNPVPVSVCRALGADFVIAVNLNGDVVGKHFKKHEVPEENESRIMGKFGDLIREYTQTLFSLEKKDGQPPSIFEAIAGSLNIMQDRITKSRMAGDPPDILISPKLSHIGLLEFYRAEEAIQEGEKCVEKNLSELLEKLGRN